MRLAIVIASSYEWSQLAMLPAAPSDSEAVARRLAEPDSGALVVKQLPGDRNLPERLAQMLAAPGQALESVLVYFSGYLAWMGHRSPALLLDAPRARAFPLSRVCRLLERCTSDAMLVLDTLAVVDEAKSGSEVADAVEAVVANYSTTITLLTRAELQAADNPHVSSPFTRLLMKALNRAATRRGDKPLTANALYSMMGRNRRYADVFRATRFRPGGRDFMLLPPGVTEPSYIESYGDAPEEVTAAGAHTASIVDQAAAMHSPRYAGVDEGPESLDERHPRYFEDVDEVTGVQQFGVGYQPPVAASPPSAAGAPSQDRAAMLTTAQSLREDMSEVRMHEPAPAPQPEPPRYGEDDNEITARKPAPTPAPLAPAPIVGIGSLLTEPDEEPFRRVPPPPPSFPPPAVETTEPTPAAPPPPVEQPAAPPAIAEPPVAPPPPVEAGPPPAWVEAPPPVSEEPATIRREAPPVEEAPPVFDQAPPTEPTHEPPVIEEAAPVEEIEEDWITESVRQPPVEEAPPPVPSPEPPPIEELAPPVPELTPPVEVVSALPEPEVAQQPPVEEAPPLAPSPEPPPIEVLAPPEPEPVLTAEVVAAEFEPPPAEQEEVVEEDWITESVRQPPVEEAPPLAPSPEQPPIEVLAPPVPELTPPAEVVSALPEPEVAQQPPDAAPPAPPEAVSPPQVVAAPEPEPEASEADEAPAEAALPEPIAEPPAAEPEPPPPAPPVAAEPPSPPEDETPYDDLEEIEEDWIVDVAEMPASTRSMLPEEREEPPPTKLPPVTEATAPVEPSAAEAEAAMAAALDAALDVAAALGVPAKSSVPPPPVEPVEAAEPGELVADIPPLKAPPGLPKPPAEDAPPEPLTVEGTLKHGDELRRAGSLDAAMEEYRRSLFLLGHQQTPERAEVYVRIGQVLGELDREPEALTNFEKALRIDPLHQIALRSAVTLLVEDEKYDRVDDLQQLRLKALTDPDSRRQIFHQRVEMWLDQAKDRDRAEAVLRDLLEEQPEDAEALRTLFETLHELGRHEEAIQVRIQMADACLSIPARRARMLVDAARAVGEYLDDTETAIELAYLALTADPSALDALEIASELLVRQQAFDRLAEIYEAMLDQWEDDRVALDLAKKLGFLSRDILNDPERATRAFELALALDEQDSSLRFALAELYESLQDYDQAIRHCRAAVMSDPTNVQGYHRAHSLFRKAGQDDTAWNAALVLDHLGEADINESLLADAHRPDGLLSAQNPLGPEDWAQGLFYPERDPAISAVLEAVAPAAIQSRIAELEQQNRIPQLKEEYREDPEKSTTTLARTLSWAARLLQIDTPVLYVYPQVKGGLSAAAAQQPSALAGRDLGSGVSANELAFLWGRHLTFFRPEHYLLVYYPTVKDLASVLLAALVIGEGAGASGVARKTLQRAQSIRSHLEPDVLETLRKATRKFPMENASDQMLAWARTVELAAGRAGLLASGDLAAAADLTRRYPVGGQLSVEERIADLMSYSISEQYTALRRKLGVAVQA